MGKWAFLTFCLGSRESVFKAARAIIIEKNINLGPTRNPNISDEGEGLSIITVTMAKRSVKTDQIIPRRTPSLETMATPPFFKIHNSI
jgi:hypothetical protein